MRLLATAILAALPFCTTAAPFVVSDPVTAGVTQCGVYMDTNSRATSPVVATTEGNICKFDLAGLAVGPHVVTMTAITVNDPIWGSQESAKSNPLAFDLSAPPAANYQGLWWVPGGAENFWGINFAHQGDRVFGTWYTYDTSGKAWWLSMLASRGTGNTYSGAIYVDTGPPFNNFVGAGVPAEVGNGTLTFTDANNGSFTYNLNTGAGGSPGAVTQTKALARFDLGTGPQPTCTFSATANLAAATNYQDLWWVASGAESGWGINFAQQGDAIFATWYTYYVDGSPLWLSVLAGRVGTTSTYTGPLVRTAGPRFDAYDPAKVVAVPVGTATLSFADGNNATFAYGTNGAGGLPIANQAKAITRFLFAANGGTICQ
jgi:hypothetical protein